MRAFTAVDVENTELQQKLVKARNRLDHGFKPVPPEKMHVTIEFFKYMEVESREEIVKALQNIKLSSFKAKVKGVGVFPSKDHVRVVWTGLDSQKLYKLEEQASKHAIESTNDHEFKPHITLSRVEEISRRDKKQFREKLEKFQDSKFGTLEVNSVKLFKSKRTGNGTKYVELEEVKL